MTNKKEKKGHQKFSEWKWKFFQKRSLRKFSSAKFFSSPQTRRQVSAYGTGYVKLYIRCVLYMRKHGTQRYDLMTTHISGSSLSCSWCQLNIRK